MALNKRDKIELAVAALIVLAYVAASLTGYLATDDRLLHVLVLAGAAAIFGDNVFKIINGGD